MPLPPRGHQSWEHSTGLWPSARAFVHGATHYCLLVTCIDLIGHRVTSHLSNDLRQPRVTQNQPAPRGDAIGLVLELVRLQLIKVLEAAGWG